MAKGHRSQIKRERNAQKDVRPRASVTFARIPTTKAKLVLDTIRGKDVALASAILASTPREGARIISKVLDSAVTDMQTITGQKAVATYSKKDVANFKLRKKMPIGVMVTLRRERMYEFLEKLVRVALPRIRDFKGIESKLDGRGNYTLGIEEQIIFPEINLDTIERIQGMNITFVTSAQTDEEGYALLKAFGLPFKNAKNA